MDFDFEFIPAENRQDYVELLRQAKEELAPLGYYVTAALAPKISDDQPGSLYEGIDYGQIGAVADYVLVMTYEWGYTYGPPMAVSPDQSGAQGAGLCGQRYSAGKILMGMPNYGYDWTRLLYGEKAGRKSWQVKRRSGGLSIIMRKSFTTSFLQAPFFTYFDSAGRKHVVWYEDQRSIRAKMALAEEYGLAGMGFWNIMDYNPANSAVLNEMYQVRKL